MKLLKELNPDALYADGFDAAYIGFTDSTHFPNVAIYDSDKCIKILMNDYTMAYAEAIEYFEYNVLGAYVGENGPIFITLFTDPFDK